MQLYYIYTLLSIHVYTLYTILLNINNYVLNYCNDFIQIELIWKMINKNENLEEVFRILCTFKFVLNNPEPSLEGIYFFLCAYYRVLLFYNKTFHFSKCTFDSFHYLYCVLLLICISS